MNELKALLGKMSPTEIRNALDQYEKEQASMANKMKKAREEAVTKAREHAAKAIAAHSIALFELASGESASDEDKQSALDMAEKTLLRQERIMNAVAAPIIDMLDKLTGEEEVESVKIIQVPRAIETEAGEMDAADVLKSFLDAMGFKEDK